jgi:hypothetical protein
MNRFSQDLDRHITGNYGEDFFKGEDEPQEPPPVRGKYLVAFYTDNQAYGGSEEGGWWYDTGELVRVFALETTREAAYEKCRRANSLLKVLQRKLRPTCSVIYSGGRYTAHVYKGTAPASFPTETPHYE